jgi:hypothetical protein
MSKGIKITWDILKYLLGIAFAAGMAYAAINYESKSHADTTFVKKEVYQKDIEYNRMDHDRIIKSQDVILEKLDRMDRKMDRKK